MNWKIGKQIVMTALFAVHSLGHAGTPGGLSILVISSGPARAHLAPLEAYFDQYDPDGASANCEKGLLNIADVRFATALHRIPANLGIAATTDARQRNRFAKSLASYRDKHLPRGFDAALIVDVKSGQAQLFGISADLRVKAYQAVLPLSALNTASQLKAAICRALVELPVLEAP